MSSTHKLAAIMFTDIVGYTQFMGSDEEIALKILDDNRELHKDLLILYNGILLKELGDGMLCSFTSASSAVKCGIELIRKSQGYKNLKLRIGIHIGEVIFSNNDVFGDGVNIASRIEGIAIPDSVLVSEKVYDEIKNKSEIKVKSLGSTLLKNDTRSREIYAITNTGLKAPKSLKSITEIPDHRDEQMEFVTNQPKKRKSGGSESAALSKSKRGLTLLFITMAMVFGSFLFLDFYNTKSENWAKKELLPHLERLVDSINLSSGIFRHRANTFEALEMALQAESYLKDNYRLNQLLNEVSDFKTITSTPDAAGVYIKSYHDKNGQWKYIGQTPLDHVRFPKGMIMIKLEKDAYEAVHDVRNVLMMPDECNYRLVEMGTIPQGMVFCQGDSIKLEDDIFVLDDYFMDQFEVTNKVYKDFMDSGGYHNQEYWKHPFLLNGNTITWEEAIGRFKDKTNQPGPSTWVAGDFPKDEENHPVAGVSWYEAAAYASFRGKRLPSYFHFENAAMKNSASEILPYANFTNIGSRKVGSETGCMHRFGTYDLAGNAGEWMFNTNKDTDGKLISGGSWNNFDYLFADHSFNSQDPFDRGITNGFRCIKTMDTGKDSADVHFQKYFFEVKKNRNKYRHVSDVEFELILRNFEYDSSPLDIQIEYSKPTEKWIKQKVSYNAAYVNERIVAYLFLPKDIQPPFQCVVYHPGSGARQYPRSDENLREELIDFLMKTGRAVLFPILKGMYERNEYYGKNNRNTAPEKYLYKNFSIGYKRCQLG